MSGPPVHSTLSSFAGAAARAAETAGVDNKLLFRQAELDQDALKNPNARYPDAALIALLEQAGGGDARTFGLAVARQVTPTTLHALGFSVLASETLLAALLRLVRYYRIVSNGTVVRLEKSKNDYRLQLTFAHDRQPPPVWREAALATMQTICRWLHGDGFAPLRVHLRRPSPARQAADEFATFFGAPLQYGCQYDALIIDAGALQTVLPTRNAELAYQNDKIVADYLARFDSTRLSERVRGLFIERLVTGKFSEEQTAELLNLSLRSLQRRLRDEQTSYQQLLDETRLDLALQYINRTSLTVAQIAPLLGFSDSSNFNRAFKRWLGISPSKYRALGFG